MKTSDKSLKGAILIVDDELSVREMVSKVLTSAGYTVLEAESGPEALKVSAEHPVKIDLLLTDLIMPGMTGRMLADLLIARRPDLDVIFMSGYIDDSRVKSLVQGLNFIQKPFDIDRLRNMILDVLKQKNRQT